MKRLIIKILYKFFIFFNFKKFFFLRVLMFHDIDEKDFSKFENLLKNLKKKYKIVDPKKLNTLSGKNNVLLTFDDGFLSSYQFSKKVLDKHKIKSLFFLVSDLLKNKNNDKIIKRISGEKNKLRLRKFLEEKHVKHLISNGHSIGIHGKSHKNLSKIKSDKALKKEIIHPIKYFKSKFKVSPNFYAYSYGGINYINKKSIKIILKNYDYLFTGIRGLNNNFNLKKRFLFRDNIETDADFKTLDFFVNGYADFLYYKSRNKFKNYIFQLDNSLK